jgi:hypothetical protein
MSGPGKDRRVRNAIGWRQRLARLQGSTVVFDLSAYDAPLEEINRLGVDIERLSTGRSRHAPAIFTGRRAPRREEFARSSLHWSARCHIVCSA